MTKTMKAGVFYGIEKVRLEERPIPTITDDDVLVKVLRAGICGSDTGAYLHGGLGYGIYKGSVFGHEFVGRVVEKGAAVSDDIALDDLVFVDPTKAKRGGMFLADVCGGFAEYVSVENAQAGVNIYKLRSDVDLNAAALVEPLSVGSQGALSLEPGADEPVVVLGAGTIGLCAVAGLINRGVKNVVAVDRIEKNLEIAECIGATPVNSDKADLREQLIERFGVFEKSLMDPRYIDPALFDTIKEMAVEAGMDPTAQASAAAPRVSLYVDCAGANPLLLQALDMCAENTRYSIVSVYSQPIPVNGSIFMSQPVIRGSAGYTHATILEVIDHIENARTPIADIVTARYPIDDFEEAMSAAAHKENGNIKVLLEFDED